MARCELLERRSLFSVFMAQGPTTPVEGGTTINLTAYSLGNETITFTGNVPGGTFSQPHFTSLVDGTARDWSVAFDTTGVPAGNYEFVATDSDGSSARIDVTIFTSSKLGVSGLAAHLKEAPRAGQKVAFTFEVSNAGTSAFSGSVPLSFEAFNTAFAEAKVFGASSIRVKLRPGASKTFSVKAAVPSMSDGQELLTVHLAPSGDPATSDISAEVTDDKFAAPREAFSLRYAAPSITLSELHGGAVAVTLTNSGNATSELLGSLKLNLASDALDTGGALLAEAAVKARIGPGKSKTIKIKVPAAGLAGAGESLSFSASLVRSGATDVLASQYGTASVVPA